MNHPLAPALSLLLLALAPRPGLAEEILLADRAEPVVGEIVSIDDDQAVLQSGQNLDAANLTEIRFERTMQEARGESTVVMWSGDELRGTIRGGDRTDLALASRSLGTLQLPLMDIQEIRCPKVSQAAKAVITGGEEDVLYLASGDYLRGTIDGLSVDGVTIDSPALGGLQTFPIEDIALVSFADLGGGPSRSPDATQRQVLCYLRDGTRITGAMHGYDSGVLRLQTAAGDDLPIRRASVASLVFLSGAFTYLSDVELAPSSRENVLPFASAVKHPLRRDQSVQGGPLLMGGRLFAKGLGVWSRSELVYHVDQLGGARRFMATVGIDDSVSANDQWASVVFRVRSGLRGEEIGQARLVYESPVLRAGAVPLEVGPLDIDGETLILEVDYADKLHVQDRAAWGAARMVP